MEERPNGLQSGSRKSSVSLALFQKSNSSTPSTEVSSQPSHQQQSQQQQQQHPHDQPAAGTSTAAVGEGGLSFSSPSLLSESSHSHHPFPTQPKRSDSNQGASKTPGSPYRPPNHYSFRNSPAKHGPSNNSNSNNASSPLIGLEPGSATAAQAPSDLLLPAPALDPDKPLQALPQISTTVSPSVPLGRKSFKLVSSARPSQPVLSPPPPPPLTQQQLQQHSAAVGGAAASAAPGLPFPPQSPRQPERSTSRSDFQRRPRIRTPTFHWANDDSEFSDLTSEDDADALSDRLESSLAFVCDALLSLYKSVDWC